MVWVRKHFKKRAAVSHCSWLTNQIIITSLSIYLFESKLHQRKCLESNYCYTANFIWNSPKKEVALFIIQQV